MQLGGLAVSVPIINDDNAKFKLENERNYHLLSKSSHLHEYGNVDVRNWSL